MHWTSASVCDEVLNLFSNSVNGLSSFCLIFSVSSIILKINQGWHKLWTPFLYSSNTSLWRMGGSWYKSPRVIILNPANSWLFGVANISFRRWWICSRGVFDTIENSSMINSFKSDSAILICVLFLVWHRWKILTWFFRNC